MAYKTNRYYTPQRPSQSSPQVRPTPPTRFKPGFIKCIVCILLLTGGYFGITYSITAVQQNYREMKQKELTDALNGAINPILKGNNTGVISVALFDPSTKTLRTYGQTNTLPAASTAKVITALAYYHAVEQGKVQLSDALGAFTASYQMQQMINQSNNESWELLVQNIGRPYLQSYATSIGADYTVADNTMSAGSLATILSQLESGTLLNASHTAELLGYMQQTNEEDLIPAGVPAGVTVYHKYGLLNGTLHDASVLRKGTSQYGFVVYTQNTDDSDDAARTKIIQQITKAATNVLFR